jgi:transposase
VWSGNQGHHHLNRGGNRQVNAALHRIAITQWHSVGSQARAYVQRRLADSDTKTEALRLLRICDEVLRRLLADEPAQQPAHTPARIAA